jgi:hypothetical protein
MIEHLTIARDAKDRLTNWQWRFWYDSHTLCLDWYCEFQRPTKRHSFRTVHSYSALNPRGGHDLAEIDVVLPADVREEAVTEFCRGITVKRRSNQMNPEAKHELLAAATTLAYDYIKHSGAFHSLSGEEWEGLAGKIAQRVLGVMDQVVDEAVGAMSEKEQVW